jgi:diguanylate cyclase (GGDEF)-like protein
VGERLRMEVERARPAGLELTLSAGVAAAAGESVRYEELFRRADAALLRAKREGRNRVVGATGPLLSRAA